MTCVMRAESGERGINLKNALYLPIGPAFNH
jgi:hypothetical protein